MNNELIFQTIEKYEEEIDLLKIKIKVLQDRITELLFLSTDNNDGDIISCEDYKQVYLEV